MAAIRVRTAIQVDNMLADITDEGISGFNIKPDAVPNRVALLGMEQPRMTLTKQGNLEAGNLNIAGACARLACWPLAFTVVHAVCLTGSTYSLREFLMDKTTFPGMQYCGYTKTYNFPFQSYEHFESTVIKLRRLAMTWGWAVHEEQSQI